VCLSLDVVHIGDPVIRQRAAVISPVMRERTSCRLGRTLVTAIGLAAGVGLVMGIIRCLPRPKQRSDKGTFAAWFSGYRLIVTRTVAPTLSTATTTTTTFGGGGGSGAPGRELRRWRRRLLCRTRRLFAHSSERRRPRRCHSSVITDLAKLGPAGTKVHPRLLCAGHASLPFPAQAVGDVAKVKGVTGAVGALSARCAARDRHRP